MRVALILSLLALMAPAARAADPFCTGTYSGAAPRAGRPLRFGVDPGLAGSAGGVQLPATPDDPARDLAGVRALRPAGRVLVVRLNRLFESDGAAGIARFAAEAARYGRAGMEVEIQVRYHPSAAQNGDLVAWQRYVRRVVDVLGRVHGVVAMTITNEVNLAVSPNTSDGSYQHAQDALISGIEVARAEALRDHRPGLRFGFTYAYRFSPQSDVDFFAYLRSHGGRAFARALGFVGIDFYPGSFYPPVMAPGDSYRTELAQAAGTVRECLAPLAGIPPRVPLWFTEIGVPVGVQSEGGQAAALAELVRAAQAYSGTFGITDLRWFNLRDSVAEGPEGLIGPLFATDGLLRDDYSRKPAFTTYRSLIASLGVRTRTPVPAVRRAEVTITLDRVLNRFRPDRALGAGVDGRGPGDTARIYTPGNIRAMNSAGYGALTYRLRTELAVEAWHWNAVGRWSDPAHAQGYWTGSARPGPPAAATFGYRLPRRGDTIDQANNDGYSRLDDGSLTTFWKSNPYLDPHFTHQPEAAHPQWLLIDFGVGAAIDGLRIAWGAPYAQRFVVESLTGREGPDPNVADGYWSPVASFTGRGGVQTVRLWNAPHPVQVLRVVLFRSSHTTPAPSSDVRDRLGFAVREVYAGVLRDGRLQDMVRHRADNRQSVTYVSSTDPWHRASDVDPELEQPSFVTLDRSGLLHHQPMLTPVPTLYGTPDDAAAEVRYLRALHVPVRRMELGEEPDGQLVTPEDYGALYVQFARRLHRVDRRLQLGGPGYQTSLPDWDLWPLRPGGDTSWTRRFLGELRARDASRELSFFSFEWYPFDDGCAAPGPQLASAPGLLSDVLARQHAEGLPRSLPTLITEYGYSSFAARDEVDLPGALLNADIVGRFLADGGTAAYLYGLEPDVLVQELPCRSWGNLVLFLGDDARRIRQPVATLWAAQMVTRDWVVPGDGLHALLATELTPVGMSGPALVGAYAVRRPGGRIALLLINRDAAHAWSVQVRLRRGGRVWRPRAVAEIRSFSSAQYRWHPNGARGYARPDGRPALSRQAARRPLRLPPFSLTVVLL